MSSDDTETKADGGITKEDIFGTGERAERTRTPATIRLRALYDAYVRVPFIIAWNDWRTRIGGILIVFYVLMGTVGVWLVPEGRLNEGPNHAPAFESATYWLGTDHQGRSIAKEIVHATPAMLEMAIAGIVLSVCVGTIVGFVAGYKGGAIDRVLMTVTDTFIVIPGIPLIVVLVAIFPVREPYLIGAIIAIDRWPGLARELRSQVLTIRESDYIEAGRAMGLGSTTIIGQEVTPKLAPYILINASFAATYVIGTAVALYFIGILPMGANDNWGVMINRAFYQSQAGHLLIQRGHILLIPMLALSGLTFALVLFSQGLDRIFNPRLLARHGISAPSTDTERDER